MSIPIEYYEKLAELIEFRDGKPYWKSILSTRLDKPAGTIYKNGYRYISLMIDKKKKNILVHRLHWFMVYGELPVMLDHINRVRDDNRIQNLRPATYGQNNRNRKVQGKSKYKGIYLHKSTQKWCARCKINKKSHHLGLFASELEAAKAYDNFCIENNLTFANLNFKQENIKQES